MTINNGWISVLDTEHRPESGEEILTLSYVGDEPDSPDPFADPEDRAYCLCTYFYPGDQDWNEVPGDPSTLTPTEQAEVTCKLSQGRVEIPIVLICEELNLYKPSLIDL